MTYQLFQLPRPTAISNNLTLVAGAKVRFFLTGTNTPTDTYEDSDRTTPHTNPVVADAAGRLPAVYLDPTIQYRVTFTDAADVEIYPAIDPVNDQVLSQSVIGLLLYPRTTAEIAAGVTPANYFLVEGHVERYSTWVNSSTDFTTAFQNVAAVARNKPGLVIQFTPGRTYATTALGGATLFNLQGARGVTVFGNGAKISAGNVNSGILEVFDINGAEDIRIHGIRYEQTYQTLDSANGARFFRIRNSASRIFISDCYQLGGLSGISCIGDPTTGTGRSDQITAINCRFEKVYYPQNFQVSGDQYFARGIKTINCGRSYFPYNCRQHDVQMFSQPGGPFDDVLLKVYADPGSAYNKLEQIKLVYHSDGRHASGSDQSAGQAIISIDAQQNTSTSTAAQIDSIDIQVSYEAAASPTTERLFQVRKFTHLGVADTTARGHVFSNIRIGGRVRSWQNATGPACVDWFNVADGYVWTGDTAVNCSVENFYATGSAAQSGITINYQPFPADAGISLSNVYTDMQINRVNANEQHSFAAEQVVSATIICGGYKSYTPTVTGSTSNPTLGNGTATGRWRRNGDWVDGYVELTMGSTTSGGVGNIRISLPTLAAVGEGDQILGGALILDAGTRFYTGVPIIASNTQYLEIYADQGTVTYASPFSYANGDKYRVSFRYLTAP
jgi:hypothetical protein